LKAPDRYRSARNSKPVDSFSPALAVEPSCSSDARRRKSFDRGSRRPCMPRTLQIIVRFRLGLVFPGHAAEWSRRWPVRNMALLSCARSGTSLAGTMLQCLRRDGLYQLQEPDRRAGSPSTMAQAFKPGVVLESYETRQAKLTSSPSRRSFNPQALPYRRAG